jgi:hypothetical protein
MLAGPRCFQEIIMAGKSSGRLVPARPHTHDESAAYMPRIPWRYVILGVLSLVVVGGGYWLKEQRKTRDLRAAILRVHETELAQAREAYAGLRNKLESLVLSAAQTVPENFVDPRLNIPGLRSGNGLYLRLMAADAKNKEGIARGAKAMEPDNIGNCLGVTAPSVRGLYEKGEFLTPQWISEVKKLRDVMSLRVQDEVLSRHIRSDLPSVLGLLRSDWFMLVLQEGPNRRDAPVDVFLWDLRHGESLLRAHLQSRGVLLTTRILSKGAPAAPALSEQERNGGAANDCSIAAQLKEMAGRPAATVTE